MKYWFKFNLVFLLVLYASCAVSVNSNSDAAVIEKSRIALLEAEEKIDKFRKGKAFVNLENFKQKDLKLKIRQISHDFKFGCYLKIDNLTSEQTTLYEKHFGRIFNYAVIGTYWDVTENKRGEHFWTNFDKETAMAKRNGWRIQTAPILWGTNQAGTPNWLPKNKPELQNSLDKRIKSYFEKYSETANDVELVNEPLSSEPDVFANILSRSGCSAKSA